MAPRETLRRSLAPFAQPPPSLGGGVDASPSPYIKDAPGEEENTTEIVEPSHCLEELSFLLLHTSTSHRSLSHVVPLSELRRIETTPPLHAVVLRGFAPESIHIDLLPAICWIGDPEGVIIHRMCVSTRRSQVRHPSCCDRVIATGVVARGASSTRPSSATLRSATSSILRQRLCGSVIPAFRSTRVRDPKLLYRYSNY